MSFNKPMLASWERRLLAAAVDGVLVFVGLVGFVAVLSETVDASPLWLLAVAPMSYIAFNSSTLRHQGLSIGRAAAAVHVVSIRGPAITISQSIIRPAVRVLMLFASGVGALFVNSRLHSSSAWTVVLAAPVLIELTLIAMTPWRRSVADLVAGTLVVRAPPLQPHRAPAYPMYSRDDNEFGPRP